jgi:filamentous hemagglutinin family protein
VKMQAWVLLWGQVISITLSSYCVAQVVPDQTLPVGERSRVSGDRDTQIDGGAVRGNNLFHSFQQFSIPTGGSASFNNALDITNIITRVTGSSLSNIDGLIRANGTANLFLINPNGILFGANARLEIGGSFLASTANSLQFADGFEFNAKATQALPLLTISAPIGLQFGSNPGTITVQGNGHNLSYDSETAGTIRGDVEPLQVQPERTLALVGGNIILEGGNIRAETGRIELGSVALGNVSLNENAFGLRLGYSGVQRFGNILLSQKASVDASGAGGGSIQVQSRQLFVNEGSAILSITTGANTGGDFTVNATDSVELLGESADQQYASAIFTESQGMGSSGNLTINTRTLRATDGAYASTYITSSGDGGNLTVNASDSIELLGRSIYRTGLYAGTSPGSSGNSGDMSITTNSFKMTNGSIIFASTDGDESAGDITINAGSFIIRDGARVSSSTNTNGNAGSVTINAGSLLVRDGGRVSSSTSGDGNAGNVTINVGNLVVRNTGQEPSQISASTFGGGAGGNLTVNATDSIELIGRSADGQFPSGLFAQTEGFGNAGNLRVNTRNLIVRNGARVAAGTFAEGSGGNLIVNATDMIELIGESADGQFPTGLSAQAEPRSLGNAGDLSVETRNLIVRNGAGISSASRGSGAGGNLIVNATDSIQINGAAPGTQFPSRLSTRTTGGGNAGDMRLRTGQLRVENGAQISSQQATATATGTVGNIHIEAESILVGNNGRITIEDRSTIATRQRAASVGNINIQTNDLTVDRGGISAETASTDGGNVDLDVQNTLLLQNESLISTNAGTAQTGGNGGNITFDGGFIVAPQGTSNISANAFSGRGGNIDITTQGLFGIEPRDRATDGLSSITASSQFGISGTIDLNTPDIDPSQGIAALPSNVIDTDALLASSCVARRDRPGRFVITGTGGLAPQPDDLANSAFPTYELMPQPPAPDSPSVIEADRIERTATGEIVLGRSCQ